MRERRKHNPLLRIFEDEAPRYIGKTNGLIKTWRDPYDAGYSTTYAKEVQFRPGVTVLVGCNGSGKSTLINNIESVCDRNKVANLKFDNLSSGGSNAWGELFHKGDYELGALLWGSSEGESISINVVRFLREIKESLSEEFAESEEIWLLMDASDSGLSIDNVLEFKELFKLVMDDCGDRDVYIVIAANEYELASGMDCMDVMTGKYLSFKDYEDYKQFIIKSRIKKDNRIEKAREKRLAKEQKGENNE